MLLVTTVLLITLGILIYSRARSYRLESEAAMRMALRENHIQKPEQERPQMPRMDFGNGKRNEPFNITPVFVTMLDENQEISKIVYPHLTDVTETLVKEAVSEALATENTGGHLPTLKLRFLKQQTPDGLSIAFADTVSEIRSLKNLILTCLLVLLLALSAFLFISIYLAHWALRPVEKAWEQQNRFIADASHELKTPLTVILANLRILMSHPDSSIEQEAKWLQNTQEEAGRMKELVENLLFLARSDAESTPRVKNTFSLSDLVWNCLLPFEPLAFEQGVTLTEDIQNGIDMTGDAGQMKQLIAILLDNACKYAGNEKKAEISLYREHGQITLTVRNTGTPIPEEDIPHLFERFYRTDKSRARSEGGYGLGLSIAETIVRNHRGKIAVKSDSLSGTAFIITLPGNS